MLFLKTLFMLALPIKIASASVYYKNNATNMFLFFKDKYHKVYKNSTYENNALANFIKNLNTISVLNEKSKNSDAILVLNKHADLDTEGFEEHFALKLLPYDNDTLHRGSPRPQDDSLRTRIDMQPEDNHMVEPDYLYDLNDADKLYQNYMKHYNKKNATKKYDRTVQYYRFIKTLVELNKAHFKGDESRQLDSNADVVKKPFEYVY